MAKGITQWSDISSFIVDIWEPALSVARHENLMAGLVKTFRASGMAPRKVTEYSELTARSIGEDDDLSADKFTRSLLSTLTPGEIGLQVLLSDPEVDSDDVNIKAETAKELGGAVGYKVETDQLGLFSSLTGGTIGSAGATITWGYFAAARTVLRNAKARPPYYCVMHDYQWHELATVASIVGTTVRSDWPRGVDEVMRRWYVGQVFDVMIFTSNNISIDSEDDAYAAMFSRDAMALDIRRPFRLEPERDASRRGWEINATMIYAYGVWRPTHGVQMIHDCVAPTS